MFEDFYTPYKAPTLLDTSAGGTLGFQNAAINQQNLTQAGADSTFGKGGTMDTTLGGLGKMASGAASLGQIYVGLKSLDIAGEELDLKKDQWKMSKEELKHMQATRKRLTASYMGRAPAQAQAPKSQLAR